MGSKTICASTVAMFIWGIYCLVSATGNVMFGHPNLATTSTQWNAEADSLQVNPKSYTDTVKKVAPKISSAKAQAKSKKNVSIPVKPADSRQDTVTNVKDDSLYILLAKHERAYRAKFRNKMYDYIVVDCDKYNIAMHLSNSKGKKYNSIAALLGDSAATKSAIVITNAGMYTEQRDPQGLYIENGKQIHAIDTLLGNSNDNFHLQPNGVFYMDSIGAHVLTTKAYIKSNKGYIKYATQSGPMLVIDGMVHPKFTEGSSNLNIRSGVGVRADGKVVFAISETPCNFFDFAMLFKTHLGCKNALYLDGAISLMYLPDIMRLDKGGSFGPIISVTEK